MASNACLTVATQTLYSTSVGTVVQSGDPILVTITEGDLIITSTSFNPTTQTFTDVDPTATLYATQCPATTAPPLSTTTSAATTTYRRSSTQAGGNVVVQTFVETIQQNGTVIQTQTSTPPASTATLADTRANLATNQKQHTGAIAGGIVGAVLALVAIFLCLWFVRKRRRNAIHSRNLDDFFSDPTAAGWQDKPGNGPATAKRAATLRSMRSQSAVMLDLEKERDDPAARNGDSYWAALAPVEDGEEEIEHVSHTRPQSRQSLNTLGRPMSFHSMSMGHGLELAGAAVQEDVTDPSLLRNDSDRSSKSNVTPPDEKTSGLLSPQSPDLVPAFYGAYSSSSPPPISPTSSPPPLSPYGLPASLEATPYEAWNMDIDPTARTQSPPAAQRYNSVSGPMGAGRSSFGSGMAMLNNNVKQRTWSNGALQQADLVQRPRSAQGLARNSTTDNVAAGFAARVMQYHNMQPTSPPHSPSMLATNVTNGASVRARGSFHYPNPSYGGSRSPPPGAYASPSHHSPTSAFPPSQYAHLDIHKTEEEREEDLDSPSQTVAKGIELQTPSRARVQRRHQSLSSDILLRAVKAESEGQQPYKRMTETQNGERTARTLSIRNAD
jgi:hypothetical protein